MKTSKPLILASIVLLGIAAFATYRLATPTTQSGVTSGIPNGYQQMDDIRSAIGAGLAEGNVDVLANYLAEEVSLDLLEEGDIYFKEEAVERMTIFFAAYPCKAYQEKHRGSSGSGEEQYVVGELKTANNVFRTYILTKNAKIIELKISEE